MTDHLVVAQPAGQAEQLMLLFHGMGAAPADMRPLGERLAAAYPRACVVCVAAPNPGDYGLGRQWFSTRDLTDERRTQRVADALPAFLATIREWQAKTGTGAAETALIGFSQGAIMTLECAFTQPGITARVVSIGGRFARLPETADERVTLYLLHGKDDPVVHYGYAVTAAEHLVALGADVVADVLPFAGHEINDDIIELLLDRLSSHVPRRIWREALAQDTPIMRGD